METSNFQFEWDLGNTTKNKEKHGVSTEEAESVFYVGLALPLGIDTNTSIANNEERLGLIGKADSGKILQIAFVLRKKKIRIISARPANKKERKQYEENIHKIFKGI